MLISDYVVQFNYFIANKEVHKTVYKKQ